MKITRWHRQRALIKLRQSLEDAAYELGVSKREMQDYLKTPGKQQYRPKSMKDLKANKAGEGVEKGTIRTAAPATKHERTKNTEQEAAPKKNEKQEDRVIANVSRLIEAANKAGEGIEKGDIQIAAHERRRNTRRIPKSMQEVTTNERSLIEDANIAGEEIKKGNIQIGAPKKKEEQTEIAIERAEDLKNDTKITVPVEVHKTQNGD